MILQRLLQYLLMPLMIAAAALCSAPTLAQPAGARGDDFLYRVMGGTTLIDLATRFTTTSSNWAALQTLNQVEDPYRLVIGSVLRIPFALIPEVPSSIRVSHVSGPAQANGAPLTLEAELIEGDKLITGPNGFATLVLEDDSVLSVPETSSLTIERLRAFKGTGLTDSILTLVDGSLESHVSPAQTGVGRFEIRTPVSITGVRGTQLRVHTSDQGAQSEILAGSAVLDTSSRHDTLLRKDQGVAINAQGHLLGVRNLLPAPTLPEPARGGKGWVMSFPPVPGAAAYLTRVASNAAGTHLISTQHFDTPDVTFSAPGPGTYYALVRAIDADGVMGKDASMPFLGRSLLRSSDGSPVVADMGQFVLLTEY